MVEIAAGKTKYIVLPDTHPIKQFCRKHKIDSFTAQNDLMDLINECIKLALESMIAGEKSEYEKDLEAEELAEANLFPTKLKYLTKKD